MAISKFKNGKTTEHDPIQDELINVGGEELKKFLYELISNI